MTPSVLISQIEQAWATVPYPGTANIFTPESYDDEDIVSYFGGTTWKGHSAADLRAHSSAFTFFTPAAWHYWLPAFLKAAIEDPAEADVCVEHIAESIFDCFAEQRVPLLTHEQVRALCSYFQFQIDRFGDGCSEEKIALSRLQNAA